MRRQGLKFINVCLILAVAALVLMACPSPTSTVPTAAAKDAGVRGCLSGVVIDSITGKAIPKATVSVASGPTVLSVSTNDNGVYELKDLIPGSYTVSYKLAGYSEFQSAVQTVDPAKYIADDPFKEWSVLQSEVANMTTWVANQKIAMLGNGTGTALPNSQWTYNAGSNTYSTTSGSLTLTYDNSTTTPSFKVSTSKVGDFVYEYSINIAAVKLVPLSSGIKANLKVVFAVQHDANSAFNESMSVAAAKDGVELWARENITATTWKPQVYGPVKIGANGAATGTGEFLFSNVLPADVDMTLFANPFSQANGATPAVTYFFADSAPATAESDILASYIKVGSFHTTHNVTETATVFPAIYAYDDKAIIVGHSVGSININNLLAVDGSFTLSFNKAIDKDSFVAYVETSATLNGYTEENDNGIWESGEDAALDAVWNTAATQVTLKARDKAGNAKDGYLPYGLNGSSLVIANARASDGTSVAYTSAALASTLKIFTEKAVKLVGTRYLDSGNIEVPQIAANMRELPFAGSVELTFDKTLSAVASNHEVLLYKWTDANSDLIATSGELSAYIDKPTVTISGAIITIGFGNLLAYRDTYALALKTITSGRPGDTLGNLYIGFRSNQAIALKSNNLYRNSVNIYHNELPTDTIPYFPVKSDLTLTFATAVPTGVTPVVELYKSADITALTTPYDLLQKRVITTTALSTDSLTLTISHTASLELNTAYALAVKLVRSADNVVLFSSQSPEFFKENSVDSASAFKTNIVDTQSLDNTGGASYYITFTTEKLLALLDKSATAYPTIATNIAKPVSTSAPATLDFKAADSIKLEFNKSLATPAAADVKLYYWRDTGVADTVEKGELTETPALVSVAGGVITIAPTSTLMPGLRFAIRAAVTSLSDAKDKLIYDTLDTTTGHLSSLSFQVVSDFVDLGAAPTGGSLLSGFVQNTKPTGQVYTGVDSAQAAPLAFKWDLIKDLPGEAGYYKVYEKTPADASWNSSAVSSFAENSWYTNLWATQMDGSAPLADRDTGTAGIQSWLLNGGSIQYMVQAYTKTGFLKQSAALTVADTVGPQLVSSAGTNLGAATNWGALTFVNNASGTKDTYTNNSASPVLITYSVTNTNGEMIAAVPTFSASFTAPTVTAAWVYNAAHTGIDITITVPATIAISGGDAITVGFRDSSNNLSIANWAAASPSNTTMASIADTP